MKYSNKNRHTVKATDKTNLLQVVNFRSGGKLNIRKKGGKEENVFKEYLFLFSFLFFSFF